MKECRDFGRFSSIKTGAIRIERCWPKIYCDSNAVSTIPTEDSVRRAVAIQMIINKELGLMKNENFLQGSYAIEALTNLVEKAILKEFESLNARGGVFGAMETMYQRSKIQEERFKRPRRIFGRIARLCRRKRKL